MTYPPHDQPDPDAPRGPEPTSQQPTWDPQSTDAVSPWVPAATPPRRSRRGLLVGAAVAGVLALGGGGYAVAAYLSGGGAQPQDVLPDTTLAFVTLDLDPAMGQKAAVASLLEKFPSLEDAPEDLRGDLLDGLLGESGVDVEYARDLEPWLGDRMALAAVPAEGTEAGMAPVLVLAVEDEQAMTDSLERLQDGGEFGYAVRDEFVLLALDQETADRVAGAGTVLADDSDYAADRDALGGDHLAVAWADLGSVQGYLTEALGDAGADLGLVGQGMSGRLIMGLHAEDDALELVGLDVGASELGPLGGGSEPTRLVGELPEDALAGISAGGLGEAMLDQWSQLEESGALAGLDEQVAGLGIELPGDLPALLGSDLAVVVRGDLEAPAFGVRVATEDPQRAVGIVESIVEMGGPELGLSTASSDGGYVVASDPALADALGSDGGLGGTDAFQAAVADPEDATAVVFVDLSAIVGFLVAQGGETGAEAEKWSAVEALGISAAQGDEGGRFVLRVTTR